MRLPRPELTLRRLRMQPHGLSMCGRSLRNNGCPLRHTLRGLLCCNLQTRCRGAATFSSLWARRRPNDAKQPSGGWTCCNLWSGNAC